MLTNMTDVQHIAQSFTAWPALRMAPPHCRYVLRPDEVSINPLASLEEMLCSNEVRRGLLGFTFASVAGLGTRFRELPVSELCISAAVADALVN